MKHIQLFAFLFTLPLVTIRAGEEVPGATIYSFSIEKPFKQQSIGDPQLRWKQSLLTNLHYQGSVLTFAPTDIPLHKDDKIISGSIFQCIEKPHIFFDSDSYTCIDFSKHWIFKPGNGGISFHTPKSRSIIVCLLYEGGGLPYRESTISTESASWKGSFTDWIKWQNE